MSSRSLRCHRSGRPMHPFITFPTKDGALFGQWYCPDCHRKVRMHLTGKRGCWYRVYSEHPREGVTNRDWNAWKGGAA